MYALQLSFHTRTSVRSLILIIGQILILILIKERLVTNRREQRRTRALSASTLLLALQRTHTVGAICAAPFARPAAAPSQGWGGFSLSRDSSSAARVASRPQCTRRGVASVSECVRVCVCPVLSPMRATRVM